MQDISPFLEPGKARDELVVVLHGFKGGRESLAPVRQTIHEEKPDADIYGPEIFGNKWSWLSFEQPEDVVAGLVEAVDWLVDERSKAGGYKTITLVGHSFGAVLARKIAIAAHGEQQHGASGDRPAPFEPAFHDLRTPRHWAPLINRIVLLAGMNRGWSVSSAMDWITSVKWSVWQLFEEIVREIFPRRKHTLFAIRKGAPFLVQTRLQWLALMDPDYGGKPDIVTVQLLGTGDDFVSPDDNVDYSVDLFGREGQQSYFYIEVRCSDHSTVVEMGPSQTTEEQAERRDKFTLALTADPETLGKKSITREQMADNLPPKPDKEVTDVVFVMHGIRDKGFWTQKLARTIKRYTDKENKKPENDGKKRKIESWTESYGYFAMLPFMFRAVRQRKVEWLMDRYAEARARYPRADFHYMGHSNGTYLAAKALRDYPAARFKHIVFAGSVVRCDYDWDSLIRPTDSAVTSKPRIEKVLNYVATRDWVVALFPKGVQRWRRFDLGSAGHDGFGQASPAGPVHEVKYIIGSHGAGHEEPHWNDIAHFIVTGNAPPPGRYPLLFSKEQSSLWRALGEVSWILFPFVAAIVLVFGIFLFASIFWQPTASQAGWHAIGFFIYLWIVYLAVTRF